MNDNTTRVLRPDAQYPDSRLVWTPLPQIKRYEPAPVPAEEK